LNCPHWKVNGTTSDSNPQSSCCICSVLTFLRHGFPMGGIVPDYGNYWSRSGMFAICSS
jgi:hypothetical protein